MKLELRRIVPLRAANVGALVYGLLTCVFAVLFVPFFLVLSAVSPRDGGFPAGPLFALGMLFLYPILGVTMGWLTGLFTALIYNLVIRLSGGLLLEVDGIPAGGLGA